MPTTLLQTSRADSQTAHWFGGTRRSDVPTPSIGWLLQVQIWIARSRQRTALGDLAEIDEHLLRDIGKTKAEALREAAKPFWEP
jgi:uncharacterized protein YjiS (DUF1127 family)